jgi:predicted nuclease of restriction endonuclease-like (RecB) superfamily
MKEIACPDQLNASLVEDVRSLISSTKDRVAKTINHELVLLYWRIGARIRQTVLNDVRAEYGKQVVTRLAAQMTSEFGRGFNEGSLSRMMRLAEIYPTEEILATLSQELTWSHFCEIIPIKQDVERDFYAEMCRLERWSVRTLRQKIDGMLFQRTALSRKPEQLIRAELDALRDENKMTADLVFRDPYVLDFLGLEDSYSEKDLETGILRELERFLMEFGAGFAFVARQKRLTIGGEDFYLDLLFYHRDLQCLVAIDLKLGRFTAAHKGQMELYLRWLDANERRPDENPPLGLVLCSEKNEEQVKLLQLHSGEIRVAEYLTELPTKELLMQKLHEAARTVRTIAETRAKYESNRRT